MQIADPAGDGKRFWSPVVSADALHQTQQDLAAFFAITPLDIPATRSI